MSALAALLRPATEKLIELGQLRDGTAMLDLGCADGPVSTLAARRLGPADRLVAVDPSEVALAAAQRHLAGRAELRLSPLESLDMPAETFEVALSQLGLDVTADARRALAETWRVLRPGGRLAVLTLGTREKNSFLTVPFELLRASAADAPGIDRLFRIGGTRALEAMLSESGFIGVRCQAIRAQLRVTDADGLWATVGPLVGWTAEHRELSRRPLAELVGRPGGGRLSMEIVLALADKPRDERDAARPLPLDDLVRRLRPQLREISAFEARRGFKDRPTVFLDVREPDELAAGRLPGALHLPRGLLEIRIAVVVPDQRAGIVVYSEDGRRSALAALRIQELGYESVWTLTGGFRSWQRNGYAIENGA